MSQEIRGIYAAVITPFGRDSRPAYDEFAAYLKHLAQRGCHGALIAGTTGEGPSLSVAERTTLFKAAARSNTGLRLLAGAGASSLEDSIAITRAAFDAGAAGVVVIPPFFYSNPPLEGLLEFYTRLIRAAVPVDGNVLLYHNPTVSAPTIDRRLIARLRDAFPHQVVGIKDSSSDWAYTQALLDEFPGFQVFVGDDQFLAQGLAAGAAGAITLVAGLFPDLLRTVYDLHEQGAPTTQAQERLTTARRQIDDLPRIAATKWLLKASKLIAHEAVRPPLSALSEAHIATLGQRFHTDLRSPIAINLADLARK